MPLAVFVHHGLPHLYVQVQGPASLNDLCGVADLAAAICARAGYRRALVDMQAAELSLGFTEHLQLGSYVAERFASLDRVATVVTPDARNGTSEKAAQKLGLRLCTFTDPELAQAWIGS